MRIIIDGKEYVEKESKDSNTGNRNVGDWNSGYWNSGNFNSGYNNTGNSNSGDWNSGNWNSGNRNVGNWNSGNFNSGYFNIDEPKVRIFWKETDISREDIEFPSYFYLKLNKWILVGNMTDKEKEEFSWYKTTKGYLKKLDYKEAWKQSFEKADKEDVAKTLNLPNFDYDIFEKITGISKEMLDKKLKGD